MARTSEAPQTLQALEDLVTRLLVQVDDLTEAERAGESWHGRDAGELLAAMPRDVVIARDDEGRDTRVTITLTDAEPSLVLAGEIAGCGDCMISAHLVALWGAHELRRPVAWHDPLRDAIELWWARARRRRPEPAGARR